MAVCEIRCFNEMGKFGYVALLDSQTRGKRNCIKYIGKSFGTNFNIITAQELALCHVRVVRSAKDFGRYIKELYPNFMVNPIKVGNLTFDLPCMYFNNTILARWEPIFEKDISYSSFNIISDGAIIEYNYQQPIYISVLDAKRHVPKMNAERLLVNQISGVVTRYVSKADPNRFYEANYHLVNGGWVCDSFSEAPIAGYKLR